MFRLPRNPEPLPALTGNRPRCGRAARGLTLVELMMSMMITSLLTLVVGGLTMAVRSSWDYTTGLHEAEQQAGIVIDRIRYMTGQAGAYKVGVGPTVLGLSVVPSVRGAVSFPDILVVWSGGRSGGIAENGVLDRLPTVDELVVYAIDANDPHVLKEYTFPGVTTSIDFTSLTFNASIRNLLASNYADGAVLANRLRISQLPEWVDGVARLQGNARFDLEEFPTDGELSEVSAGTDAWNGLTWAQGIVSGVSGLRQTNLSVELQVETLDDGSEASADFIARFGSAGVRYMYEP